MIKVSALICTFQEEQNIAKCIKSLEGVDEIIVADDSSTDKTREIAESMGAKVVIRHDEFDIPTKQDIKDFKKRFGWEPSFTTESKIYPKDCGNYVKMVNLTKNDWMIGLSADEVVTWDLERIKKEILPTADQVECDFVHSHEPDGSPTTMTHRVYLIKKSMTKFIGRTHGTSTPNGNKVYCPFFRVDHWQTPNAIIDGKPVHSQAYVLPIMEYAVLKENDGRSRFYLGREYYYKGKYDQAIKLFDEYLEDAGWMPEIAHTHLYKARCYWESMRGDQGREECLKAVLMNPDHKEALYLMSEMYFEPWKSKWKFIADNATNKDILF